MAIEKAMAKRRGSYDRLSRGTVQEALYELTGAPCLTYQLSGDRGEEVWT